MKDHREELRILMSDQRSTIQALLIERLGYERRGLTERVKQVDELLARLGYQTEETATLEPQKETATRKRPLRRTKG